MLLPTVTNAIMHKLISCVLSVYQDISTIHQVTIHNVKNAIPIFPNAHNVLFHILTIQLFAQLVHQDTTIVPFTDNVFNATKQLPVVTYANNLAPIAPPKYLMI